MAAVAAEGDDKEDRDELLLSLLFPFFVFAKFLLIFTVDESPLDEEEEDDEEVGRLRGGRLLS